MATKAAAAASAGVPARGFMADQAFFARYAIALVLFILFSFAQFSLRGFVQIGDMPLVIHAHAAVMVTWLAVFATQNVLVVRGELGIHRTLGWISAGLVAAIAVLGCAGGLEATRLHILPPFFTPAYFISLTTVSATSFAVVVAWAVSLRRRTEWHRRIMFGSMFLLLEPALGRLLPMPLLGDYGEWIALAVQLGFVAILARHDRKVLGAVHPATWAAAAILIVVHSLVSLIAVLPPVVAFANGVAGA